MTIQRHPAPNKDAEDRERGIQLGIIPRARRVDGISLVFWFLLVCAGTSLFVSGVPRRVASGLLLGAAFSLGQIFALPVIFPRAARFVRATAFMITGAILGTCAAILAYRWWGVAGAVVATVASCSLQLLSVDASITIRRQLRSARAFEARLAAGADPAEVDAFVARASRWRAPTMFESVGMLYRYRRLTNAVDLLLRSRVDDRVLRAEWLITLRLELADVAIAREIFDCIQAPKDHEAYIVLASRVRIAEGTPRPWSRS